MNKKKAAIELSTEQIIWFLVLILFAFVMFSLYMGWLDIGKGSLGFLDKIR